MPLSKTGHGDEHAGEDGGLRAKAARYESNASVESLQDKSSMIEGSGNQSYDLFAWYAVL